MKKRISFGFIPLIGLLLCLGARADLPPNNIERSYSTSRNDQFNPGFEQGLQGYVASSSPTMSLETTATQVDDGKSALKFVATTSGQTITGKAITVPSGSTKPYTISCRFKTTSTDFQLQLIDGSGNVLTDQNSYAQIPSSTEYSRWSMVTTPGVTTVYPRFRSQSAGTLRVDNCYTGKSDGINAVQISQANRVAVARIASTASCLWSQTSSTLSLPSPDSDCPGPTWDFTSGGGTFVTTDTDLPQFTINNLPPGEYFAIMNVGGVSGNSAGADMSLAISDGTNTRGAQSFVANTTTAQNATLTASFTYTSAGNRTFSLYTATNSGTELVNNGGPNYTLHLTLLRYPTTQDLGFRFDALGQSATAEHGDDCAFVRTNTAFGNLSADSVCTFTTKTSRNFGTISSALSGSDKLPGIVFTPSSTGYYEVCALAQVESGTVSTILGLSLTDGTVVLDTAARGQDTANTTVRVSLCGNYFAASTGAATIRLEGRASSGQISLTSPATGVPAVSWRIKALDTQMPAPILLGAVSSNSAGLERIERVSLAAPSAGTCAVSSQSGSWVSGTPTSGGTGTCAISVAASIFSGNPTCTCSVRSSSSAFCSQATPATSSTVSFQAVNDSGTSTNQAMDIICMGPR